MKIPNSAVQEYFNDEPLKIFNKQISTIRKSSVSSDWDKKLFNSFVRFCQGWDSAQFKALRMNSKLQSKLVPQIIDRVIDLRSFVVDLRKKPSTVRYQEVIKIGSIEQMEQDCLLALVFSVSLYETAVTEKK